MSYISVAIDGDVSKTSPSEVIGIQPRGHGLVVVLTPEVSEVRVTISDAQGSGRGSCRGQD